MGLLISNKSLASFVARLDNWIPRRCSASAFEIESLLGPFLRISAISPSDVPTTTLSMAGPALTFF